MLNNKISYNIPLYEEKLVHDINYISLTSNFDFEKRTNITVVVSVNDENLMRNPILKYINPVLNPYMIFIPLICVANDDVKISFENMIENEEISLHLGY